MCFYVISMSFLGFSFLSLAKDARNRDRHVCFVRLLLQKLKSLQQRAGYTLYDKRFTRKCQSAAAAWHLYKDLRESV